MLNTATMGWSRQLQIKVIFFIAVILLLSLSVFSYFRIDNLLKTSALLNHTNIIKLELVSVFSKIKDADSHQRGFVLTKDSTYIRQYRKSIQEIYQSLSRIDTLTNDNYSQQVNNSNLRVIIAKRIYCMDGVLKDASTQNISKKRWMEARGIMEEIRQQTDKMINEERFLLKLRTKSFTKESAFTPLFTIFLTIASILILIAAYFEIIRELNISNKLRSDLEASRKDLLNANVFLEDKNESLAKMNEELEAFTYISSHDLQEPLRKIQTFITRIIEVESERLSENGRNYLKRTQDSANRMQNLIRDLLAYSRLKSDVFPTRKANLHSIVNEVKVDLEELILDKKVVIEVRGSKQINIIESQFRQLLTNLISNAIKFARPDVPSHIIIENTIVDEKSVPFENTKSGKYSKITVTDNGIGFDNAYKSRIFEVFQRLHSMSEYPGTGIGLAIVKKITENHHGFITADSDSGTGAVFTIYIPV